MCEEVGVRPVSMPLPRRQPIQLVALDYAVQPDDATIAREITAALLEYLTSH